MFGKICRKLIRAREIRRTETAITTAGQPPPPELLEVTRHVATWRLEVPGHPDVRMKVDGSADDTNRYVVHVDAKAFYLGMIHATRVLRTSPHGSTCMALKDMPRDYKYDKAAACFAQSASNPVPLAQPVVSLDAKGRLRVDFNDGITRTYWLLANGCSCFPVEMHDHDEARMLFERAGVSLQCVAALFGAKDAPAPR